MEAGLAALAEFRVRAEVGPVLRDFCARRSALIKALTDDVEQFCAQCDPDEEKLCLYGDSNGRWRVAPPAKDVPPDLPEPVSGINLFRNLKSKDYWLNFVAHRSDLWLLSLALFEGTSSGFGKKHRKLLYKKIDQLPKILEVARMRRNSRAQVQRVFNDFTGRSRALLKALTEDTNEFCRQCVPDGGILCLFGDTNGQWRVGPPDVNVPPGLPQPEPGINLYRGSMPLVTWLSWVARFSDIWLRSLASFEATNNIGLHQADRLRVHDMIEQLPTLYDVVRNYHVQSLRLSYTYRAS
ncbi:hypothetical protein QN277_017751 [Acacia crassicarpa]|uniref:PHD finger protein ALFIN-LIKE n=1 Tax=Acacia crassicarpa TaxID=499986 RepID=A0AAE1JRY5_9FABA|nr:hypothetical protein QN277_017751 [Acacia crassicarpa]